MKLNGKFRVDFIRKSGQEDYDVFGASELAKHYAKFLRSRGYTVTRVWNTQTKEEINE